MQANGRVPVLFAMMAGSVFAAELIPPAQQTTLVRKYCAVCHTDAVKNGGLSLQHYDAELADPALAAMLLSKLRNGAMGAAGLGIPDAATRDAWVAATTAQAQRARDWTVIHEANGLTASIVREVAPRKPGTDAPVYRLTLACNGIDDGMQLTWSPSAQVDRTFFASADGAPGIPQKLQGREQKMGNGAAATTGLASAILNLPLPEKTLTIADLFPGETVVFPLNSLNPSDRRQIAACLP